MHKAFIDPEKCGHCAKCKAAKACPHKAITRIDSNETSVVDATYCRGCGDCNSMVQFFSNHIKDSMISLDYNILATSLSGLTGLTSIAICPKNLLTASGFSASIVKKPLWSTEVSCGQIM